MLPAYLNILCVILVELMMQTSCSDIGPSTQSLQGLVITMEYNNAQNSSVMEQVTIYNNTLNQQFNYESNFFNCDNLKMFTLQQNSISGNEYSLILSNYSSVILVQISVRYNDWGGPANTKIVCNVSNESLCTIPLHTNCTDKYSDNIVTATIKTQSNQLITELSYNSVCNSQVYQSYTQIQWGEAIIIGFAVILVFTSAKFQFTIPYANAVFFINYFIIAFYFLSVIVKNVLLMLQIPNIIAIIRWICIGGSILCGIFSSMVCFTQLAYFTKFNFFRWGYTKGRFRLRITDIIGFLLGVGMMCAWYFSGTNWIISNTIFVLIYLSFIKIVKIGSLKFAVLIYIVTVIVDGIFYKTFQRINNEFTNQQYNIFNNPLFFIVPLLAHIPNRKCEWYFLLSMAYPALFMAYLYRFDINRSSKMYSRIFILCFIICSIISFVVAIYVPFPLPYDLFTVPISVLTLFLFANRRDELKDLWTGQFYDEQKAFYQNELQLIEKYDGQKKTVSYNGSMFSNLKYSGQSSDSSSRGTKNLNENFQLSPFPSQRNSQPPGSITTDKPIQIEIEISVQKQKQLRSRTNLS